RPVRARRRRNAGGAGRGGDAGRGAGDLHRPGTAGPAWRTRGLAALDSRLVPEFPHGRFPPLVPVARRVLAAGAAGTRALAARVAGVPAVPVGGHHLRRDLRLPARAAVPAGARAGRAGGDHLTRSRLPSLLQVRFPPSVRCRALLVAEGENRGQAEANRVEKDNVVADQFEQNFLADAVLVAGIVFDLDSDDFASVLQPTAALGLMHALADD